MPLSSETPVAVMSRYLRPPNTSLFVRNVADDTRCVQTRDPGPIRGGRKLLGRTRAAAAAAARWAGGGEGEDGGSRAGFPAPARPRRRLNRRGGARAAPLVFPGRRGERGPRGWASVPLPLRTSEPLPPRFLSARPAPAEAEHPFPIDLKFTFFGVHAPSAQGFCVLGFFGFLGVFC